MVEQIQPNLFRIEVPLLNNPLKYLNAYLVRGSDRSLLVDTGFNRPECLAAIQSGLAELGVELKKTDLFITHLHADHCGLAGVLKTPTSKVYASEIDGKAINGFLNRSHWDKMAEGAAHFGFDAQLLEAAVVRHPGYRGGPQATIDFSYVSDQQQLVYGDFRFIVVAAPGHTDGHLCLYEPDKRLFFAGDNILNDITPNITAWFDHQNTLADYYQSLAKIEAMAIHRVLPAHRSQIADWRARVQELKQHHERRLAETEAILAQGRFNGYQVAARMSWDIRCNSFAEFPVPQQWFALGEAVAHIRYLEALGRVRRIADQPIAIFTAE